MKKLKEEIYSREKAHPEEKVDIGR